MKVRELTSLCLNVPCPVRPQPEYRENWLACLVRGQRKFDITSRPMFLNQNGWRLGLDNCGVGPPIVL